MILFGISVVSLTVSSQFMKQWLCGYTLNKICKVFLNSEIMNPPIVPAAAPPSPPVASAPVSPPATDEWIITRSDIRISYKALGRGAWGRVMEGSFRGSPVAIKQIHSIIISDYNRERFTREIRMMWRCRHPNIVMLLGATIEGTPVIVTELMKFSLRSLMSQRRLTPVEVSIQIYC